MPKRCVTTRCNNKADPKKRISIRRKPSTRKTQYLKREGKMAADFVLVKRRPVKLLRCARFTSKSMTFQYCMDSKTKRSLKADEIRLQEQT